MTDPLRDIKGQKLIPDTRIAQAPGETFKDIPNWFDLSTIKFVMEIGGKGHGPTVFFRDGNGNGLELHQDPKDKKKFDVKIKRKGFARATELELTKDVRNKLCEAFEKLSVKSSVVNDFMNPPSGKDDKISITPAAQTLMKECAITYDDWRAIQFPRGWHTKDGRGIDMYEIFNPGGGLLSEEVRDENVEIEKIDNKLVVTIKNHGKIEEQIFIDPGKKEVETKQYL